MISGFDALQFIVEMIPDFMHYIEEIKPLRQEREKEKTMSRNKTVDLLRFILSLMIIPIHADLFIDVYRPLFLCFTLGLVRVGVPFFFIVSGYYLQDRIDKGKSIRKSVLRYLRLWILFILLDLAITGWYFYPTFPNTFAFLHKALFTGLSDAYWFLPVLVISQLILVPVFQKGYIPAAVAAGFILYLFAMTHDSYSFLFEGTWIHRLSGLHTSIFIFPQGGLVESVFFLSVGGWIRQNREKITVAVQGRIRLLVFGIILFSVLLMTEAYLTQSSGAYDGNCYLSLVFLPALLFILALVHDPVSFDTQKLGEVSLYIYLIHPIAVSVLRMAGANSVIRTLGAAAVSLVIGFAVTRFLRKRQRRHAAGQAA